MNADTIRLFNLSGRVAVVTGAARGLGAAMAHALAGAGAMVGAFGLAAINKLKHHGLMLIVSGLLFGISLAAFALAPSLWVGAALLFVSGVTSTVFGTMIATFIQVAAPREIRGRIMSLYSITLIGLPSLGALGSGAVAESLGGIGGAPRAVLIGAIILCVIVIASAPMFWKQEHVGPQPDVPSGKTGPA